MENAAPNKAAPRSQTETASHRPRAEDAADKVGLRKMLNEAQVLEIMPYSPATLLRMEKAGRFPRGTFVSPNRKIWWLDEVIAWQREIDGSRRGPRKPNRRSKPATE